MTPQEIDIVNTLLRLAFEYGRNYEQIYLDLKLYDIIDLSIFEFAQEKGAQWKFNNAKIENIVKAKYNNLTQVEQRKFIQLKKLEENMENLTAKYLQINK